MESIAVAAMFPYVNEKGDKDSHWELDRVEGAGKRIVFLRYDEFGKVDADLILGGEVGRWRFRASIWGTIKEISEVYDDRAEALEEAREWMAEN